MSQKRRRIKWLFGGLIALVAGFAGLEVADVTQVVGALLEGVGQLDACG